MHQIEVRLNGRSLADAMAELRIWFDRNNYVPQDFGIAKLPSGELLVRVEFSDDMIAAAFERGFAR